MIPGELPNWIVAVPLFTMAIIDVLWGLDLIAAELAEDESWWRCIYRSGDVWLGVREIVKAIFLLGALGFVMIIDPNGTTPTWFGAAMIVASIATVLAWVFLSLTPAIKQRGRNGT